MQNPTLLLLVQILLFQVWNATAVEHYRKEAPVPLQGGSRTAFVAPCLSTVGRRPFRDMELGAKRQYKLKLRAAGKFRIKPKTNKSVAKRFKITATGKIIYRRAGRSHLQRKKSQGAKRRLRRPVQLKNPRMIRKILSVLHNR